MLFEGYLISLTKDNFESSTFKLWSLKSALDSSIIKHIWQTSFSFFT